jgi:hypothetical protein
VLERSAAAAIVITHGSVNITIRRPSAELAGTVFDRFGTAALDVQGPPENHMQASGDFAEFVAAKCETARCYWAPVSELAKAYAAWCEGRQRRPPGSVAFAGMLRAANFRAGRGRRRAGKQVRSVEGVRIRSVKCVDIAGEVVNG